MKLLNEIMLNKLLYQFKIVGYNCLPFNLAFSDEFLKLNEQENGALENVINHLINKELIYRDGLDLCLSQKGKKWIKSLKIEDIQKNNVEKEKKSPIPPYDLLRMLVSFYKLKKTEQEIAIKELVKNINDFKDIDEILKEFEKIIEKI